MRAPPEDLRAQFMGMAGLPGSNLLYRLVLATDGAPPDRSEWFAGSRPGNHSDLYQRAVYRFERFPHSLAMEMPEALREG